MVTIGSLNYWHEEFISSGAQKAKAKMYQNVINPPLLTGDDSTKTLEKLNISELHCMTGSTGKVVSEMERCAFETKEDGEKFMNDFLKRIRISLNVCIRGQLVLKETRQESCFRVLTSWREM